MAINTTTRAGPGSIHLFFGEELGELVVELWSVAVVLVLLELPVAVAVVPDAAVVDVVDRQNSVPKRRDIPV